MPSPTHASNSKGDLSSQKRFIVVEVRDVILRQNNYPLRMLAQLLSPGARNNIHNDIVCPYRNAFSAEISSSQFHSLKVGSKFNETTTIGLRVCSLQAGRNGGDGGHHHTKNQGRFRSTCMNATLHCVSDALVSEHTYNPHTHANDNSVHSSELL